MPKPKGSPKTGGRLKQGDAIYYERCTPEKKEYLKKCSKEYDEKMKGLKKKC